ncbi:MAG TPA: hypothetical protein VE008_07440 [Burkholderiales bacterium]|nr:hypothetical protein [Burkholderiales bacterium]
MTRTLHVSLRKRILACVAPLPEAGGPRPREWIERVCRTEREREVFDQVFGELLEARQLVMVGIRGGAKYGLPKRRRPRGAQRSASMRILNGG